MNRGFYLTLMMGGFNASPVGEAVIDALTEVQVTSTVGSQAGFQLKFGWGKNSEIARMMAAGAFDPRQRVIIAVTVNGSTEVLMDGIITKQDFAPSSQAGKAALTITGLDLTALMDFIDFTGLPYPAMPPFAIVDMVLAKYAPMGVYPVAIPNAIPSFENPLSHFVKQQGTDYAYIQSFCQETGWIFYLNPGPTPGTSMAYWGPDISKYFPSTQPAMSINIDAETNVDSLSFSYDGMASTQYIVTVIEPESGIPIVVPVPNIGLFKATYAAQAPVPLKSEQGPKGEANISLVDAALWGLGKLFASSDAITGSGSLDVLRYGHVFKARELCQVRGAGDYYDGKYYVKSVTHNIKRGEYKQNFTLARGGVKSSISTVSL